MLRMNHFFFAVCSRFCERYQPNVCALEIFRMEPTFRHIERGIPLSFFTQSYFLFIVEVIVEVVLLR